MLAGRFDKQKPKYDPCLHWRYFGDPPEFMTLLVGGGDGLHRGYVVEDPEQPPLGLAGYFAYDDGELFQMSASLFGFLWEEIEERIEQSEQDAGYFPDPAEEERENIKRYRLLHDKIDAFTSKHDIDFDDGEDLDFIDHCNDPPPEFEAPEEADFPALPALVRTTVDAMVQRGVAKPEAQLHLGRFLWHWHIDGNAIVEDVAYSLLREAYKEEKRNFLLHVLEQHKKHRHRPLLDVFD